jgi:ABC-type multidrug transport system ATPase subunit
MLCCQGLSYLIGIVFIKYELLAIEIALGMFTFSVIFCNFFLPIKRMSYLFQMFSNISFHKYIYNSGLIIFYGFNRCSSDQFSLVFNKFGINDEIFWTNANYLTIYSISLRIFAFIALYIKTNTFLKRRKPKTEKSLDSKLIVKQDSKSFKENMNSEIHIQSNDEEIEEKKFKIEAIDDKISIAWIDLSLRIPKQNFSKEKIILRQLNGCLNFGSLNALMGPSGAGKTTLLKCINGRNMKLLSNQTKIYLSKFMKIRTCFISQDVTELLIKGLTAKQTLIYASKLKNSDRNVNYENSIKILINDLLISDIEDTNVENCSGGEQKRLVMAMELTSYIKPYLLCIDEPTSGLDSNAAEVVIKCLKVLSRKHKILIITSIHQPNNDILMLFDKIYVLSKGGICVYFGSPQNINSYLKECDIKCQEFQKPIEVLLRHVCNGVKNEQVIKLSRNALKQKEKILKRCSVETKLFPEGIHFISKRFKLIDFWNLLMRTVTYTYRYFWKFLLLQFVFYVFLAVAMKQFFDPDMGKPSACISFDDDFENTCNKTSDKIEEEFLLTQNLTYNIFLITMVTFVQMVTTTMTFTSEVNIFLFEQRNGKTQNIK